MKVTEVVKVDDSSLHSICMKSPEGGISWVRLLKWVIDYTGVGRGNQGPKQGKCAMSAQKRLYYIIA